MSTANADFIAKLCQIEEQANCVYAELGPGVCRTRLQHIVVLATTLRSRLEFGSAVIGRNPVPATSDVSVGIGRSATAEA